MLAFNLNKSVSVLRSVTSCTCSSVSHSLPKQLQRFRIFLLLSCLSLPCTALWEHMPVHLCHCCPKPSSLIQTHFLSVLSSYKRPWAGAAGAWQAFSCYHGGNDIQRRCRCSGAGNSFLKQPQQAFPEVILQMVSVLKKSVQLGFATEIKILVPVLMVHKLHSRTRERSS